jgi:hypothetical protein
LLKADYFRFAGHAWPLAGWYCQHHCFSFSGTPLSQILAVFQLPFRLLLVIIDYFGFSQILAAIHYAEAHDAALPAMSAVPPVHAAAAP